jgi:hypothetical protein
VKVSIILSIFKAERYLERYFEEALQQKGIDNIEFSIVHNNPTRKEKEIISAYRDKLKIVYQSVELESIYQSWNRAIAQSSGEYLACWNVDDLRNYDSIYEMQKTLDNDESVGFTYGDIVIVNRFGKKVGRYVKTKKFTDHLGTTGAIGGPFFMWRKNLVDKIGFFDEQFKSGGDFDYTVRLSISSKGKKTEGLIGYFLNDKSGLSTSNYKLQIIERTVIEIRYGIWYKLDINYIAKAFRYDINQITENGLTRRFNEQTYKILERRKYLLLLVFYGFFKNSAIRFLQKITKSRSN